MKKIIALIDKIVRDEIENNLPTKGAKGIKGRDGRDFDFEENKDQIKEIVSSKITEIQDTLKLHFKDLSQEDRDSLSLTVDSLSLEELQKLRGEKGPRGQKGKSFTWDAYAEEILETVKQAVNENSQELRLKFSDLTQEQKSELTLKFENLSEEEIQELKGLTGSRGKNGKSFEWEDHCETIDEMICENVQSNRNKLKLNYEDLTEEEKQELKGEKGPRGQKGKSFNWDAHSEEILEAVQERVSENSEDYKLRFSDLTQEEKNSLKLTFTNLSEENKEELTGKRGPRGLKGKTGLDGEKGELGLSAFDTWSNLGFSGTKEDFIKSLKGYRGAPGLAGLTGAVGQDGKNGADAPVIVDIDITQKGEKFFFTFYFNNNTSIETDYINIPSIKKFFRSVIGLSSGGAPTEVIIQENGTTKGVVETINFTGVDASVTVSNGVAEVTYQIDPANVVIRNVPCDASVYVGAAVRMDSGGTALNALADNISNANVLGIVESKPSSTVCNIRVSGVTGEDFAGLDVTKLYFLSDVTAGLLVTTIPTVSGTVRIKIGQPFSDKTFFVSKGEPVIRA